MDFFYLMNMPLVYIYISIYIYIYAGNCVREMLNENYGFSESVVVDIIHQIISGVSYLHSEGVWHLDLKPENIVCERGSMNIKITDYGLSILRNPSGFDSGELGNPAYSPPEVFLKKAAVGKEADIWSMGTIMYELLCNHMAFGVENLVGLTNNIVTAKYNKTYMTQKISKAMSDLVIDIMNLEPKKRPTFLQILGR